MINTVNLDVPVSHVNLKICVLSDITLVYMIMITAHEKYVRNILRICSRNKDRVHK